MSKISIVGLGPGEYSLISQGALDALHSSCRIYLRTEKHPIVNKLKETIKYTSLDYFYDSEENFEDVYYKISKHIVELAKEGDLVYAVPGHPRVAEKTVGIIESMAKENNIEVETIASMSFVDAMFNYLAVDPADGFKLIDAFEIENSYIDTNTSMIITQIYDHFIASNIKLKLMEYYDYDQEVCIVNGAGVKNLESKKYVPLYELDRSENLFNYLTSLYIPKSSKKMYNTVHDLEAIMNTLRGENGCDWDKKQTHESLKKYVIEEAYELCQAIDNDDIDEMIEELGDILLQVIFHCQIGKEEGYFDLKEVVNGICTKLINRHPHVFNNVDLDYCHRRGITVCNVAGYSSLSVAQHTFALALELLHKNSYYHNYVQSGQYSESGMFSHIGPRFYELHEKTWGIIGMGNIGRTVAKIAEAFGCQVQYYSTSGKNTKQDYLSVDLETLLKTSDIVSIHCPLNEQTKGLIGEESFKLMKKEAILINVGRGGIVDEEALVEALQNNEIAGAGLDVFEREPLAKESPLLQINDASKLLMTPHIAWATVEARNRLFDLVVDNIQGFLKGDLKNVC